MSTVYVTWFLSAVVLLAAAALVGRRTHQNVLGIFIDNRNRFSLSQFQITMWTIVVLSLLAGIFLARVIEGAGGKALDIEIPNQLLILMGISVGSTATAAAVKAGKDLRANQTNAPVTLERAAAARFSQVVLEEEGTGAEQCVSVTKFQNFWITVILLVAYMVTAFEHVGKEPTVAELTSLPDLHQSLNFLLGISHAGYIGGKLPDRK